MTSTRSSRASCQMSDLIRSIRSKWAPASEPTMLGARSTTLTMAFSYVRIASISSRVVASDRLTCDASRALASAAVASSSRNEKRDCCARMWSWMTLRCAQATRSVLISAVSSPAARPKRITSGSKNSLRSTGCSNTPEQRKWLARLGPWKTKTTLPEGSIASNLYGLPRGGAASCVMGSTLFLMGATERQNLWRRAAAALADLRGRFLAPPESEMTTDTDWTGRIAYGGVSVALFGSPQALVRYYLPLTANGEAPTRHTVLTKAIPHFDQGARPICAAVASVTLVSLALASLERPSVAHSPAYTYLAGEHLVHSTSSGPVSIEPQVEGGLPLASCVEAVCLYGVLPRVSVPFPDDPQELKAWMARSRLSLEDLRAASAELPTDFRPLRLFPSEENLKAALIGAKPVAFSFRIDGLVDRWMRSSALQAGSGFRVPPTGDFGARLATHACVIVGFDDDEGCFKVRNSFGASWGLDGDFWVPYGTMLRSSFANSEFYVLG